MPPHSRIYAAGFAAAWRRGLRAALLAVAWPPPRPRKDFPRAKIIKNFRELLEKEKGIDAVMIATPDHSHATIAIAAMEMGKPV